MKRDIDNSTVRGGGHAESVARKADVPGVRSAMEQVKALVDRAQTGDASALPELRECLDTHPELWQHYGDLAQHATCAWTNLIAGVQLHFREAILKKVAELRDELLGSNPMPIERLLVQRVVATWLQLHFFETAAAKPGEMPVKQAEFIERRLNYAQRRYLTAMKSLVETRRLLAARSGQDAKATANSQAPVKRRPTSNRATIKMR